MDAKPIHVKPSFYSYCYEALKEIALKYGYNLVIHGSMNRDLDLIAIPWQPLLKPYEEMIQEFTDYLGGTIELESCTPAYHGRLWYVINIRRRDKHDDYKEDHQYYLDISVLPVVN